jgi:hypothetical protein
MRLAGRLVCEIQLEPSLGRAEVPTSAAVLVPAIVLDNRVRRTCPLAMDFKRAARIRPQPTEDILGQTQGERFGGI